MNILPIVHNLYCKINRENTHHMTSTLAWKKNQKQAIMAMKLNTWHFRIRDYTHLTITNFGKKWLCPIMRIFIIVVRATLKSSLFMKFVLRMRGSFSKLHCLHMHGPPLWRTRITTQYFCDAVGLFYGQDRLHNTLVDT